MTDQDGGPSRFVRLQALFEQGLALPDGEREAFVAGICADDASLGTELRALLREELGLRARGTDAAFGRFEDRLQAAMPEPVRNGTALGRYTILGELGTGGMGRVYRAQRVEGDLVQTVAIKLLRPELLDEALLERFANERRLLAQLNHPGICRFIDVGSHEGMPYVVMELVEGEPLLRHCDQHQLDIPARLALFRQVLAAVSHAHQNLIIHRDLKSSNILVDAQGFIRLLDFGIAKTLAGGDARLTRTQDRFLSLANAAPEQLRGERLGVACDIYALGTVLYELLCGSPPFDIDGLSAGAVEAQILTVPPAAMTRRASGSDQQVALQRGLASPSALGQRLRGDLERIVQQCLRKRPEERYASVELLDEDIDNILQRRPIRAARGQGWYVLRKFVERNRLPVALATALVLGLGLTVLLVLMQNAAAVRERDRAEQALAILREAFLSADPANVGGEQLRVGEVLDAAESGLRSRAESQPDLYATLAGTLAEVRLRLGQNSNAAELFDQAVVAAERAGLSGSAQFKLRLLQARAWFSAGMRDKGEQALSEARSLGVAAAPELWVVEGIAAVERGELGQGAEHFRRAIKEMGDRSGNDDWHYTASIRLADALAHDDRGEEGAEVLQRVISGLRSELGAGHPRVATTELRWVAQLQLTDRGDEAIEAARDVHGRIQRVFGEHSPMTAKAAMVYGNSLVYEQRYAEAATLYRQAASVLTRHLGPGHLNSLYINFNLAVALSNDPATHVESLQILERTLATAEQELGLDSNAVILFRSTLAEALLEQGHAARALKLLVSPENQRSMRQQDNPNVKYCLDLLRGDSLRVLCADPSLEPGSMTDLGQDCAVAARLVRESRTD